MQGGAMVSSGLTNLSNQIGQSKENEIARSYNSDEAQKSRDYNTWLLGHATQLKVQDARSAGLNPAFMNGSVLGSTPTPSSAPSSPNTFQPFDSRAMFDAMRSISQIANTDADTKKTEAETDRQLIENTYLPQMMQSQIDVNYGDLRFKASGVKLNEAQARQVTQKCLNLQKEIEVMNKKIEVDTATIDNLNEDVKLKLIDEFWKSKEYKAKIQNLCAQTHLSYEQANDLVQTRVARIFNLEASAKQAESQASYTTKLGEGIDIENGRLRISLEMDEKYKEWDKWIDMSGKVLGSISDVANVFSKFTTKKVRSESYSRSDVNSTSHSTVDSNVNSYSHSNVHTYKEK